MAQWPGWCQQLLTVDCISVLFNRLGIFRLFKVATVVFLLVGGRAKTKSADRHTAMTAYNIEVV